MQSAKSVARDAITPSLAASSAGRSPRMRASSCRTVAQSLRAAWGSAGSSSARPFDSRSADCLARLISRGALDAQASGRFAAEAPGAYQRRGISCSATSDAGHSSGRMIVTGNGQRDQQSFQHPNRPPRDSPPAPSVNDLSLEERQQRLARNLNDMGIELADGYTAGKHSRQGFCPHCKGGEKKDNSFLVTIKDDYSAANWICYRAKGCGHSGWVYLNGTQRDTTGKAEERDTIDIRPRVKAGVFSTLDGPSAPWARPPGLDEAATRVKELDQAPEQVKQFLTDRKIDLDRAMALGVGWVADHNAGSAIAFRYYKDNKVVNIKYRAINEKKFWQTPGGLRMLYGLEDVAPDARNIIIVEGEMDRLAYETAGIANVVSVPDGAVAKPKDAKDVAKATELAKSDPELAESIDRKFSYLWSVMPMIEKLEEVIIATDADAPGQIMGEELARRIGKEKCWKVRFDAFHTGPPTRNAEGKDVPSTAKDANDVLIHLGAQTLVDSIYNAVQWPLDGVFSMSDFRDEIFELFEGSVDEAEFGVSTGWDGVDAYYKVVPGELTIVTGVPNSGKSEWIDALMVNLAAEHNWSFALCSMENRVRDHGRKLAEKHAGKSFFGKAWYSTDAQRIMTRKDLEVSMNWLEQHFCIIRHDSDAMPNIEWIIDKAKQAVVRYGIRGLVVDPYNELEHQRPSGMTETEYVSGMLSRVKRFAQNYGVHVWFVAHPKQLSNWNPDNPPQLYDISGSAHFVNKADNGIVVHRYRSDDKLNNVEIHVKKVRNKLAGSIGYTKLDYDAVCGRYTERDEYKAEASRLRALERAHDSSGGYKKGLKGDQQAGPAGQGDMEASAGVGRASQTAR